MESDKKRVAKWRTEQQNRRNDERAQAAKQTYRSLFAIDDDELIDPPRVPGIPGPPKSSQGQPLPPNEQR